MRLLDVCTRWRNIILSVPDLWNILNISPDSQLEELVHFLPLCGSSPLDVRFWYDLRPQLISDAIDLLRPKLATVKHLSLQQFHLEYENRPFGEMLSLDMPMLLELRILPLTTRAYYDIDMHRYPVLQRLELTGAICPLDITSLRVLHLRLCFLPLPFDGFAQALEHCAQLEELQIDSSLHAVDIDSSHEMLVSSLPPAQLECLRVLVINDRSARAICAAIAQINAPALTTLRIWCNDRHQADVEDLLRTIFPVNAPCMFPKISAIPADVHLYLDGLADGCNIEMGDWSTRAMAPLYIGLGFYFEQATTPPTAFREISHLLRDIPISELRIDVCAPLNIPSAVWEELFSNMPLLERLELKGDGFRATMCEGLRRASRERLCCPRLASIAVRDFASDDPIHRDGTLDDPALWLNLLRDTLRERVEAGVKLQEFVLRESRSSLEKDESHIVRYEALLVQLQPFVGVWWYEDHVYWATSSREAVSSEHEE
ncbi:hypothetical protein VTO73DRAFT_3976 [Trametes versicolor]